MSQLPDENKLIATAERSIIQRAIWSLPKPVIWVLVVAVFAGTYFYGVSGFWCVYQQENDGESFSICNDVQYGSGKWYAMFRCGRW